MSLLSLRDVTKRFGDVAAVDRVSLEIAEGSRVVFVGPSGCGKTTLLRLIAGFETPSEGEIRLNDEVIAAPGGAVPAYARNIGYVTQDGALFPHLDVAANIGFGLDRNAENREGRIRDLMRAVGLPADLATRRPHALSGGQQQRVALARALARRPAMMLLDEPFSALDTALRESMRAMVGEVLGEAGITTVLVTHDQAEALSFADHLAVLRHGRLAQAGTPLDLYWHPSDPETATFLGEALILDADLAGNLAECAVGTIALDAPQGRRPGKVLLRPEQISVRPACEAIEDRQGVVGRVKAVSFGGQSSRLSIELTAPDGSAKQDCARISVPVASLSAKAYSAGSLVALSVTGAAHVFPA